MTTGAARIVTFGRVSPLGAERAAAAAAVVRAAGAPVGAQVFVDEDVTALERELGAPDALVVIAIAASTEVVFRAVARLTGRHPPQDAAPWAAPESEPGWAVETPDRVYVVLPASARVESVLERHLPELVRRRAGALEVVARTLKTLGVPLADVQDRLKGLAAARGAVELAACSVEDEVWVRLRARGPDMDAASQVLAAVEEEARRRLGPDCYGRDDDTLEQVVGRLLLERGLMLSVAESCTGGLVGHRLTNVPGSSAYFERGVVVYSNRAKHELLGVPEATLRAHGAVSAPTAEAMARGVRAASGAGCGLAITGIAGPDGGTPAKPVGTVFIGVAVGDDVSAHRFVFPGGRAAIKWRSAQAALDLMRRRLLEFPAPRPLE